MPQYKIENSDLRGLFTHTLHVGTQYDQNIIRPYQLAFSRAHDVYEKALDDQKKSDAFLADMIFIGLVVLAGVATAGVGGAAVATTGGTASRIIAPNATKPVQLILPSTIRSSAAKTVPITTSKNMMNKLLKSTGTAMTAAYNSTTGKRVFGNLWPEVKTQLKKSGKTGLAARLDSTTGARLPNNVTEASAMLEMEVHKPLLAAREYIYSVDQDAAKSDAEKTAAANELAARKEIMTAPEMLDTDKLEKNLLLGFFMTLLLNSDFVQNYSWNPYTGAQSNGPRRSVDVLPSDPKYPSALKPNAFVISSGDRGKINQPGGKIEDAIDEAYKALFSKEFFTNGFFSQDLDYKHLLKAENTLKSLTTI